MAPEGTPAAAPAAATTTTPNATPPAATKPAPTTKPSSAGAAPSVPGEPGAKVEAPAEPSWLNEKTKLKIKGAERELTVKEALALAQRAGGAEVTMQEAAMLRKAVAQALQQLDHDPLSYAKKKLPPEKYRELLENQLYEMIQGDLMDPKDKQIKDLQSKLEVTEKEITEQQQAQREAFIEQQAAQYRSEIETKLVKAMEGSGLPKHPIVFKMAANYLKMVADWNQKLVGAYKQQTQDYRMARQAAQADPRWIVLEADDPRLIKQVRSDFDSWFKQMFAASDGDSLMQLLGPEVLEKIRKADLAKLAQAGIKAPTARRATPSEPEGKKKLNIYEWREQNKKIREG